MQISWVDDVRDSVRQNCSIKDGFFAIFGGQRLQWVDLDFAENFVKLWLWQLKWQMVGFDPRRYIFRDGRKLCRI